MPVEAFDFKGNLIHSTRRLVADYKTILDWNLNPKLDCEVFESSTRYDALNRPIQSIAPRSNFVGGGRSKPFNVVQPVFNEANLLVKTDLASRQRSVVLAYLETLLQYAQAAMCRHSPEGYAIARLRLDTLSKFLGERPRTIFGQDDGTNPQTVTAFVPRFAPLNPRLMEIYDRVADQLDALHHCLTKARLTGGVLHVDTSYWGDDPVRRGWKTAAANCLDDDGCCCPPSPYRFPFLIQRAVETAGEVRAFGAELLAAFEKGDAEFLAAMRAAHERQLLNLTEEIRRMEFREADWQVQALQKTKQAAQARRQYYADLIANGLIPREQAYQNLTGVSMTTRAAGNTVEAVGQVMNLIPDNTTGVAGIASSPVSVFQMPIGTKLAHAFAAAARILYTVADITGTQAGLSLTEGGWDRREADWIFQVTVLDIEIQQIERQILGAERRRDSALRQLNNLVQQKQQAAELQDFLRDKFTNHALYLFLQQEMAALHHQMFEIAWCWARQAQRAFQLERELTTQTLPAAEHLGRAARRSADRRTAVHRSSRHGEGVLRSEPARA